MPLPAPVGTESLITTIDGPYILLSGKPRKRWKGYGVTSIWKIGDELRNELTPFLPEAALQQLREIIETAEWYADQYRADGNPLWKLMVRVLTSDKARDAATEIVISDFLSPLLSVVPSPFTQDSLIVAPSLVHLWIEGRDTPLTAQALLVHKVELPAE